jgi:hypothetical protein
VKATPSVPLIPEFQVRAMKISPMTVFDSELIKEFTNVAQGDRTLPKGIELLPKGIRIVPKGIEAARGDLEMAITLITPKPE